jgi:hypothetical protein
MRSTLLPNARLASMSGSRSITTDGSGSQTQSMVIGALGANQSSSTSQPAQSSGSSGSGGNLRGVGLPPRAGARPQPPYQSPERGGGAPPGVTIHQLPPLPEILTQDPPSATAQGPSKKPVLTAQALGVENDLGGSTRTDSGPPLSASCKTEAPSRSTSGYTLRRKTSGSQLLPPKSNSSSNLQHPPSPTDPPLPGPANGLTPTSLSKTRLKINQTLHDSEAMSMVRNVEAGTRSATTSSNASSEQRGTPSWGTQAQPQIQGQSRANSTGQPAPIATPAKPASTVAKGVGQPRR